MLPHMAGCMDIVLWSAARCIKFIKMACESKNVVVKLLNKELECFRVSLNTLCKGKFIQVRGSVSRLARKHAIVFSG